MSIMMEETFGPVVGVMKASRIKMIDRADKIGILGRQGDQADE